MLEKKNIYRYGTSQAAAAASGETLNELLKDNKYKPVLLLLSAGSAFSILDYLSPSSLGENLTVSMLDERFTPLEAHAKSAAVTDGNLPLTGFSRDPSINNFLQLQKLDFYSQAQAANVNFIGTLPRPGELVDDLQTRWELALQKWRADNPSGKIFAAFGMGADGHTAGIFPYPEDSQFFEKTFENHRWTTAYKAVGKHKYEDRVSATFALFQNIDEAILFACGEEKRQALTELAQGQKQAHELPVSGLYKTKHFQIFTDISL